MKKLQFLLLLLFLTTTVFAQTADQTKIAKLLEQQRQDWNKGNILEYMSGYWNSDSLVFIGKNGPKYGWKNTLENYKKSYPTKSLMGELQFKLLKIELIDSSNAYVLGEWLLIRESDKPKGYFTLHLKKFNGEWKIVYDHSS